MVDSRGAPAQDVTQAARPCLRVHAEAKGGENFDVKRARSLMRSPSDPRIPLTPRRSDNRIQDPRSGADTEIIRSAGLLAHLIRDEAVAGSNPATPTIFLSLTQNFGQLPGPKRFRVAFGIADRRSRVG
jgi:hypothetical protein